MAANEFDIRNTGMSALLNSAKNYRKEILEKLNLKLFVNQKDGYSDEEMGLALCSASEKSPKPDKTATLSGNALGKKIYEDVCQKDLLIIPTTSKDLEKHIYSINPDNVIDVYNSYIKASDGDENILSGILSEYGLSINARLKYAEHIFLQLKIRCENRNVYCDDLYRSFKKEISKQRKSWTPASADNMVRIIMQMISRAEQRPETDNMNTAPNGKIDKDFSQGQIGDCWLLGSLKAIASTPKGLKILNDSIKVNKDGSVTVTLKGVDKSYTFSKAEIEKGSHLSTGDLDVRAIEMAVNKYITEEGPVSNDEVDINGNYEYRAYKILTGETVSHIGAFTSNADRFAHPEYYGEAKITDEQIDDFNKPNRVVTVAAKGSKGDMVMDSDNYTSILTTQHTYAVIRSDSEYVYLVNPWDSSNEFAVDRKTFKEFFNKIFVMDL